MIIYYNIISYLSVMTMKSIVKSLLMSILIYIINHHIKHTTPLHPLLHTQPHPSSYFLLQAGWQHLATSWLKLFEELLNSNIYNPHNKSLGYIRTLGFEDWVSPDVISIYIYVYIYICMYVCFLLMPDLIRDLAHRQMAREWFAQGLNRNRFLGWDDNAPTVRR